jgi:hypothetical protein
VDNGEFTFYYISFHRAEIYIENLFLIPRLQHYRRTLRDGLPACLPALLFQPTLITWLYKHVSK